MRDAGPYTATGPFKFEDYGQANYQFHWPMNDLFNPLLESGLVLRHIAESPAKDSRFWEDSAYPPGMDPGLLDWHRNPRAGLPAWLTIAAQKWPDETGGRGSEIWLYATCHIHPTRAIIWTQIPAPVAQRTEQQPSKLLVAGSNPVRGAQYLYQPRPIFLLHLFLNSQSRAWLHDNPSSSKGNE